MRILPKMKQKMRLIVTQILKKMMPLKNKNESGFLPTVMHNFLDTQVSENEVINIACREEKLPV